MARYLFEASYTADGLRGLMQEGGKARRQAVEAMATSLGGRLEEMFFAFGDTDAFVICELPDDEAAAAAAMRVSASGTASVRTTKLLAPEQIDEAIGRQLTYQAPGEG
jgi:uncharacterized protein with GYD domain